MVILLLRFIKYTRLILMSVLTRIIVQSQDWLWGMGFSLNIPPFPVKNNGNILIENLFQEKVFLKCPFGFIFNHYFTKTSSITGWKNDLPVFNIPCRFLNNCLLRSLSHIKNRFWSLCWKGNIYVLTTITGRIYPPWSDLYPPWYQ